MPERVLSAILWLVTGAAAAQTVPPPLDLLDPAPRDVLVHVESSADPAAVSQSFGPGLPATYSANGNVGTLVIPVESHEQMFDGSALPVIPNTFTEIVIEFDLTTFEAVSQPASGAYGSGQIGGSFTQRVLDTAADGGFMGPDVPALFCTSQAQVDSACMSAPSFCGQTCTLVPGAAYDPITGLLNLIGIETESGCDGAICSGPFDFFATRGDLMLTEAPSDGGGSNNPCFIATAAYGTPLADQLDGLRAFRDTRMLDNAPGAALANAYYRLSPPIAGRIARCGALRAAMRGLLAPLVGMMDALAPPGTLHAAGELHRP